MKVETLGKNRISSDDYCCIFEKWGKDHYHDSQDHRIVFSHNSSVYYDTSCWYTTNIYVSSLIFGTWLQYFSNSSCDEIHIRKNCGMELSPLAMVISLLSLRNCNVLTRNKISIVQNYATVCWMLIALKIYAGSNKFNSYTNRVQSTNTEIQMLTFIAN